MVVTAFANDMTVMALGNGVDEAKDSYKTQKNT